MTIEAIQQSFRYTCDACGAVHVKEGSGGPYTFSRPPHWARLTVAQDAHDFQDNAVSDATITRLLCDDCRSGAIETINKWAEGRKP